MDFTREPIIETIVTPREGYRLVVRSSKSLGQEEHFVEAVEVVSFGNAFFFRSTERPKPFMVPVADYEILEVREPRMVLKTPHLEGGSVKIGGGRQQAQKTYREPERREPLPEETDEYQESERKEEAKPQEARFSSAAATDSRAERRRDRRRGFRRRRGGLREDGSTEETSAPGALSESSEAMPAGQGMEMALLNEEASVSDTGEQITSPTLFRSILPPPTTLIRDDLGRLHKEYGGAFFMRDEKIDEQDDDDASLESITQDIEVAKIVHVDSEEKKEASFEEEPFLFPQTVETESQRDSSRDLP